jgi:hypothetical protein
MKPLIKLAARFLCLFNVFKKRAEKREISAEKRVRERKKLIQKNITWKSSVIPLKIERARSHI